MAKKLVQSSAINQTDNIPAPDAVFTEEFRQKAMKERINKPFILAMSQQALTAYYGDPSIEMYIRAFSPRENAEKLQWRQERTAAHYQNYVKQISAKYIEGVFAASDVVRDIGFKEFDELSYSRWFRKEVAPFALIMPELYIGMKSKDVPEGATIKTKADQKSLQGVPYPVVIYPDYVHNFEIAEDGSLEWIALVSKRGAEIDTGISMSGISYASSAISATIEEFQIFTKDYVCTIDKAGDFIKGKEPQKHGYPYLPIKRIAWEDNNRFSGCESTPVGHAMMYTIIQLSLASLQFISMLVEAGYAHLNLKLMIDTSVADRLLETGMGNMSLIPMSQNPEEKEAKYLQMPQAEFEVLLKLIYEHQPSVIYGAARLVDRQISKMQSGIAKIIDMVPETNVISEVAEYLESIEQWILNAVATGYKGTLTEAIVNYPNDFKIRSDSDPLSDLAEFTSAVKNDPEIPTSPTMLIDIMRNVYRFLVPDADDDSLKAMEDDFTKWLAMMQKAKDAKQSNYLQSIANPEFNKSNDKGISDGMGTKQTGNVIAPSSALIGAV